MNNALSVWPRPTDLKPSARRRAQTIEILERASNRLSGLPAGLIRQARESAESRIIADALFSQFAYVRMVEQVIDGLEIDPGDKRAAVELAKRLCAQSLQHRCAFQPGMQVRLKSSSDIVAIVVGSKPAGFREENGWDHLRGEPIIVPPCVLPLLWTVRSDSAGIGKSRADDWTTA